MKTNEELLKYIEELEKAREADQKKIKEQEIELQKQKEEIYDVNKKLEEALLMIQSYEEKYNIERTRIVIPKAEKLDQNNYLLNLLYLYIFYIFIILITL